MGKGGGRVVEGGESSWEEGTIRGEEGERPNLSVSFCLLSN